MSATISQTTRRPDEAAVFNVDHPLIEYALPLVSQVRVSLQGRRS